MASSSSPLLRGRSCPFVELNHSSDSGSLHSPAVCSSSPSTATREDLSFGSIREVWCASQNVLLLTNEKDKDPSCLCPEAYAQECFETKKKVDNFFRTTFQRAPVACRGSNMMKTWLNHPIAENMAYWNTKDLVVEIGKWDERYFNLDVVFRDTDILTHEFAHAFTQSIVELPYYAETGSLDEATSDIFAIMHKHQIANVDADSPDASWEIAEGLIKNSDGTNSPLKSMRLPGTAYKSCMAFSPLLQNDPQIMHVQDMDNQKWPLRYEGDYGGVFAYSGIPNHAFYLMATGIGGKSWDIAGNIWFQALLRTSVEDDFSLFAGRTIKEAKEKYGSQIEDIVQKAWNQVGVKPRVIR